MQIKISGHGIEVTKPLKEYVQKKGSKLEEFYKNIQKVEVVLDARSNKNTEQSQVAEIHAWLTGLKEVQASAGSKDMYAAVDLAFDEARRQIEKYKEKIVQGRRRSGSKLKQIMRRAAEPLKEEIELTPGL